MELDLVETIKSDPLWFGGPPTLRPTEQDQAAQQRARRTSEDHLSHKYFLEGKGNTLASGGR
jgi:hypothetical protein